MTKDSSGKSQGGRSPKITSNHVIRKKTEKLRIAKQRNMRCSSSGCKGSVEFECAYTYKAEDGRVIRACFLYCEAHTRRFASTHGLELSAQYLKGNPESGKIPVLSVENDCPNSNASDESDESN